MRPMANWLFKTEPGDYGWGDLESDGGTVWDGVGNNWALKNLRQVEKGDRVLIYHTGKVRAIVGEARVVSGPYPDPELDDPKRVVVDIEPVEPWTEPLTLDAIKADSAFDDFDLVRFSRLSVLPVPADLWKRLKKMAR